MKFCLYVTILSAITLAGAGCGQVYDSTLETFGKSKKDTLIDRITAARDAQAQTKEQFAMALDEFRAIAGYRGTLLEEKYKELKAQYERCQSQTNTVENRLAEVRRAAKSFFRQWEDEMETFSSSVARRSSEEKYRQMQTRYDTVINAMDKVCDKFYPALSAYKDQVLLVKHVVNSQGEVGSSGELAIAEREISILTLEIDRAMAQADSFIRQMRLE
jgi:sugar-specific transcriptional regulator TrmB